MGAVGTSDNNSVVKSFNDKYGIKIDSSYFTNGGDERILKETSKAVSQLDKIIPIKQLGDISITSQNFSTEYKDPQYANASALSSRDYSGKIFVNSDVFSNYANAVDGYDKKGIFPQNTSVSNILVHELGHKIEYAIAKLNGVAEQDIPYHATAKAIVESSFNELPKGTFKSMDEARNSISKYANSNFEVIEGVKVPQYEETMAEAVSDYVTNGSKASPLSKQIMKNIRTAFGK